jgi:hypothetical protein
VFAAPAFRKGRIQKDITGLVLPRPYRCPAEQTETDIAPNVQLVSL